MPDTTRYLTITGVLFPDNRLLLEPGFVTDQPQYSGEDPESDLIGEFLDERGRSLLRYRIPISPVCADGVRVDSWIVAAKIPFPERARTLRFVRDGAVLEERQVPERGPRAEIHWRPRGAARGVQRVRWTSGATGDVEVRYLLAYSHDDGRTWRPVSLPIPATEHEVDFAALPGGTRCRIQVTATDGFNTTSAVTERFEVPIKPCLAMVLSPEDGASFAEGESILFQGQGYYLEESRPELEALEWESSRAGALGRGPVLTLSLPVGAHRITLVAGEAERAGRSSINIAVHGRGA